MVFVKVDVASFASEDSCIFFVRRSGLGHRHIEEIPMIKFRQRGFAMSCFD